MASLGFRPTVESGFGAVKKKLILEVYLLDFDDQVYGQRVQVRFLKKLRDEKKFDSMEQMREKISQDVRIGREFFANN